MGPSPLDDARRAIRDDALLQACLRTSTATDLDVELDVAPDGAVDARVLALQPANADVAPCIERMRSLPLMAIGCRWSLRERW
jgi:hypothetical protein